MRCQDLLHLARRRVQWSDHSTLSLDVQTNERQIRTWTCAYHAYQFDQSLVDSQFFTIHHTDWMGEVIKRSLRKRMGTTDTTRGVQTRALFRS